MTHVNNSRPNRERADFLLLFCKSPAQRVHGRLQKPRLDDELQLNERRLQTHLGRIIRRPSLGITRRGSRADKNDFALAFSQRRRGCLEHGDEGEEVDVECCLPVFDVCLDDRAYRRNALNTSRENGIQTHQEGLECLHSKSSHPIVRTFQEQLHMLVRKFFGQRHRLKSAKSQKCWGQFELDSVDLPVTSSTFPAFESTNFFNPSGTERLTATSFAE